MPSRTTPAPISRPSRASDEELWARFTAIDCEFSFDVLHRRYADPLRTWIRRCGVRDEARIQDLTQDVWIRLIRNRDRFDPSMKWGTWAFHVAKNIAKNEGRRLQRRFVTPEADFRLDDEGPPMRSAHSTELPEEMMRERELSLRLEQVLTGLTVEQRQIFTLRFLDGLSNVEVARVLDLPINTLKAKAKRVRLKVLHEMQLLIGNEPPRAS